MPDTETDTDTATDMDDTRKRIVLAVMCAGMFLVLLDVTIVNVALPSIASGLGSSVAALQWVVDGYAVTIAGLLLAGGTIGDRYGHRRVLLAGFVAFGVASVGCAAAPNAGVLIAGRVVQGIGGALLLPCTMAVIAEAYPGSREQARALGIWAAASSLALPAGPLLGGVLVGSVGWRWVFWINVPLVAVTVLVTLWRVPATSGRRVGRFDVTGLVGIVLALAAAVFAVISAGHGAPAVETVTAVVLALVGVTLVARARHAERPVLPLDVLRRPRFLAPNLVALTMNLVFNGTLFVATLYLQDVRGYSPLLAGVAVLPLAVPLVVLAPVAGRLTAAFGPRVPTLTGCTVATGGALFVLGVGVHSGLGWLLAAFGVLGCGAGLVTASVVAAVVRATPADRPGLATGMSNAARQTGTASGVAIFGAVAGAPAAAAQFVSRLHVLGVVAAVLWAAAAVLAATAVAGRAVTAPD